MGDAVTPRYRIAVDAMGGDHAPREIVRGALLALEESSIDVLLVGQEEKIKPELGSSSGHPRLHVIDAREVVAMDDAPISPLRTKRNSSIRICANLVHQGEADAFVSAGNTGAAWTSARLVLGMIEGVSRPALAAILPRAQGHTILLDVGANVDSKPQHLREFAVMGHFYAQMLLGLEHPRVGLLSIGEEEGKGNELTRETFRVLKETGLNFIGNAEGRDIYNGNADVVVCDGFIGNVVLKASEALASVVATTMRRELNANPLRKVGAMLASGAFKSIKHRFDKDETGGAPLLGVRGGCIICHGSSNAKAIKNAIRMAAETVEKRINEKIQAKISDLHSRERDDLNAEFRLQNAE
jgi:glycerol-3-phosphate acyltransferase PlsX